MLSPILLMRTRPDTWLTDGRRARPTTANLILGSAKAPTHISRDGADARAAEQAIHTSIPVCDDINRRDIRRIKIQRSMPKVQRSNLQCYSHNSPINAYHSPLRRPELLPHLRHPTIDLLPTPFSRPITLGTYIPLIPRNSVSGIIEERVDIAADTFSCAFSRGFSL